jgi:hypothetical protein
MELHESTQHSRAHEQFARRQSVHVSALEQEVVDLQMLEPGLNCSQLDPTGQQMPPLPSGYVNHRQLLVLLEISVSMQLEQLL